MPHAPEHRRRIHGATRLARATPTATAVEASGTTGKPPQSGHSRPMRLGSTTCTAMFGNGSRIVITTTMTERRQTARRGLGAIVSPRRPRRFLEHSTVPPLGRPRLERLRQPGQRLGLPGRADAYPLSLYFTSLPLYLFTSLPLSDPAIGAEKTIQLGQNPSISSPTNFACLSNCKYTVPVMFESMSGGVIAHPYSW